jgi:hypothetical protein
MFIHTYSKKNGEEERRRKEREEMGRDEKRDENDCRMCCDVHWICIMGRKWQGEWKRRGTWL